MRLPQGLKDSGFVEGQNIVIEIRSAEDRSERLPALAADWNSPIVGGDRRRKSVSALAVKAATTTVPIVFASGGDPVAMNLVANLNRPGGNVTGVSFFTAVLGAKRLELLRQLVPKATTIGVLVHPGSLATKRERSDVEAAARAIGRQHVILDVNSDRDIETAFATFVQLGVGALYVGGGPFLNSRRTQLIALAARHALPTTYPQREFVEAGGLMSYGPSVTDAYREAGLYAGRILKGEKPGDLPVMQSSKFVFVINLKTAKTLGLEFHPQLLGLADEVIE